MHSFSDLARLLNVSAVNLSRLQKRFELLAFEGQGHSDACLIFLRKLTALSTVNSEQTQSKSKFVTVILLRSPANFLLRNRLLKRTTYIGSPVFFWEEKSWCHGRCVCSVLASRGFRCTATVRLGGTRQDRWLGC